MTDHRDLPLEVARRAAERDREASERRGFFRFRKNKAAQQEAPQRQTPEYRVPEGSDYQAAGRQTPAYRAPEAPDYQAAERHAPESRAPEVPEYQAAERHAPEYGAPEAPDYQAAERQGSGYRTSETPEYRTPGRDTPQYQAQERRTRQRQAPSRRFPQDQSPRHEAEQYWAPSRRPPRRQSPQPRSATWLWGAAAVAVLTVVLVLLWRSGANRPLPEHRATAHGARAESALARKAPAVAPASTPQAPAASAAPTRTVSAQPSPPREDARTRVDALLAQADAARRTGRLDGDPQAALPLYRRILQLQPGHAAALRGEAGTLAALSAARAEDTSESEGDSRAAPSADTARTSRREDESSEILGRRADQALGAGQLQQAAEAYRAMRTVDEAAAAEGFARVAAEHARRAQRLAADFEFDDAERELAAARDLAPEAPATRAAARDLERARAARTRIPSMADASRQRQVRSLLDQAAAAMARGDVMDPPGESAYDKIAAARALAPDAVEVRSATLRLERARQARGGASTPR